MSRYLKDSEKLETRPLYEEAFYEDSKEFVDFYYDIESKYNDIIVNDDITSMIHIHYFKKDLPYLIAVATKKEKRHQGYYSKLLKELMMDFYKSNIPYVFLMPANENIYLPYGFVTLVNRDVVSVNNVSHNNKFIFKKVDKLDDNTIDIINDLHSYIDTIYRDYDYFYRLKRCLDVQNGCMYLVYFNGKPVSYIRYIGEDEPIIYDIVTKNVNSNDIIGEFLTYKNIRDVVVECSNQLIDGKVLERKVKYMYRIVNLNNFLKNIKYKEDFNLSFKVVDNLIEDNNISINIISKDKSIIVEKVDDTDNCIDIGELLKILNDKAKISIPYLHEVV